ncbi:MAG TPA: hypothetical protein VEG27_10785 [Usitatibacter sp.]|nr:hypothetical protein [Usitatibacter sp.]
MKNDFPQPCRGRIACWSSALLIATGLALAGCSGSQSSGTFQFNNAVQPVSTPALFVFYDSDGDGVGDSIARVDLNTDQVMATNTIGVSGSGGTHKRFYDGPIWVDAGNLVWGIDPDTLQVLPRNSSPSIQGNREGTVGPGIVDQKSAALELSQSVSQTLGAQNQNAWLRKYFYRTSLTYDEAKVVDICEVRNSMSGINTKLNTDTMAKAIQAAPPFHNMGYTPVGIEPSPDGKLTMFAVRLGDHAFFLDTDPNSATFGLPVRFIYPRLGVVKDQNNAVVSTFKGQYTKDGGTAPGKTNYNRVSTGTSETDKNTYTEPCDSTALRNASGQSWSWWPDVNGDTITGTLIDALDTASPQVYQVAVPAITRNSAPAAFGGKGSAAFTSTGQRTGPWMASLLNRNVGNEFFMTVENEGDNSESIWDVTNPAKVVEIQRLVTNLKYVLATDIGTAPFVNGNTYAVTVSYVTTGGTATNVNYQYVTLPADDFSGVSANVTRAYLKKVNASDPGPLYILNGLNGRAGTSEANVARIQGSGTTNMIAFSDEVWLLTGTGVGGNIDGFQIVDLKGIGPPYVIDETIALPSAFTGAFSPDGKKFYQLRGTGVDVIDTQTRKLVNVVTLAGPVTGMAFGNYHAQPTTSTSTGSSGGSSGGGGGGGGGVCNPCGGC